MVPGGESPPSQGPEPLPPLHKRPAPQMPVHRSMRTPPPASQTRSVETLRRRSHASRRTDTRPAKESHVIPAARERDCKSRRRLLPSPGRHTPGSTEPRPWIAGRSGSSDPSLPQSSAEESFSRSAADAETAGTAMRGKDSKRNAADDLVRRKPGAGKDRPPSSSRYVPPRCNAPASASALADAVHRSLWLRALQIEQLDNLPRISAHVIPPVKTLPSTPAHLLPLRDRHVDPSIHQPPRPLRRICLHESPLRHPRSSQRY